LELVPAETGKQRKGMHTRGRKGPIPRIKETRNKPKTNNLLSKAKTSFVRIRMALVLVLRAPGLKRAAAWQARVCPPLGRAGLAACGHGKLELC